MSTLYKTVEYDKRDLKEKLLKVLQQVDQAQRFITFWDGGNQGHQQSDITVEMAKASLTPAEPMVSGTPPPSPTMVNTLPSPRRTCHGQRCLKMK